MKAPNGFFVSTTLALLSVSCSQLPIAGSKSASKPSVFSLTGRSPFVVKAGEQVILKGEGFSSDLQLKLDGQSVGSIRVSSETQAVWTAPSEMKGVAIKLAATQDKASQEVSLVYLPGDGSIPVITKPSHEVCLGEQYCDKKVILQTGKKNCEYIVTGVSGTIQNHGTWTPKSPKVAKSTIRIDSTC